MLTVKAERRPVAKGDDAKEELEWLARALRAAGQA